MQMESMLNLKWDSFSSQLTRSLDTCYEKSHFVDLTLVCKNGALLKCHKIILANASSFFRALLMRNDHPHPMIILHDIEASDLKIIINFMYCGEIKVAQSEVKRILKIAEILQVSGLKDMRSTILSTTEVMSPKIAEKPTNCVKKGSFSHSVESAAAKYRRNTKKHEERQPPIDAHAQIASEARTHAQIAADDRSRRDSESLSKKRQRNEENEHQITWTKVLSQLSRETSTPLKQLCVVDEVEIRPSKHKSIQRPQPIRDEYSNVERLQPHNSIQRPQPIRDEYSNVERSQPVDPLSIDGIYIKQEIDADDYYGDNCNTGNGLTAETQSTMDIAATFGDDDSSWRRL